MEAAQKLIPQLSYRSYLTEAIPGAVVIVLLAPYWVKPVVELGAVAIGVVGVFILLLMPGVGMVTNILGYCLLERLVLKSRLFGTLADWFSDPSHSREALNLAKQDLMSISAIRNLCSHSNPTLETLDTISSAFLKQKNPGVLEGIERYRAGAILCRTLALLSGVVFFLVLFEPLYPPLFPWLAEPFVLQGWAIFLGAALIGFFGLLVTAKACYTFAKIELFRSVVTVSKMGHEEFY